MVGIAACVTVGARLVILLLVNVLVSLIEGIATPPMVGVVNDGEINGAFWFNAQLPVCNPSSVRTWASLIGADLVAVLVITKYNAPISLRVPSPSAVLVGSPILIAGEVLVRLKFLTTLSTNLTSVVLTELPSQFDAAHAKGAKVIAMTITPYGGTGWQTQAQRDFISTMNTWIKQKPTNVDYVVDTYAALDDPANPGSLRVEDTIDGIHYTASGNARVLAAIIAAVPFQANPLNTGAKPLIHESNRMNSVSDWTNVSGNIWKNSAPTYGSELTTNLTDATNFSGITTTFTAPATGSAAVDAVDFNLGTKSFKYTCTGNAATTSQILIRPNAGFAVTKDHSYILSFYAKSSVAMNFDFNIVTTDWGTTL